MPIFTIEGKNLLFIHVPKTGGTSIEKVLSRLGPMSLHNNGNRFGDQFRGGIFSKPIPLQHLHGQFLRRILHPSQFDKVFMVVRDPVQRMISEFRHARALWRPEAMLTFSVWLAVSLGVARLDRNFRNNHFRPQADFYIEGAQVFHYEDGLLACLNEVAATLGLSDIGVMPWERRSVAPALFPTDYDVRLIQSAFAADYTMFPRYRPKARFQGIVAANAA